MTVRLEPARRDQLPVINRVIEQAIMQWDLPERVKRLSLSTYLYNELDFEHLDIRVALDDEQHIVGVTAWEPADKRDTPDQTPGLLLHGLYVSPVHQHQGIGSLLLHAAITTAKEQQFAGLLVKAQKDAIGFFSKTGMTPLPVKDEARHYPNRFWQPVR